MGRRGGCASETPLERATLSRALTIPHFRLTILSMRSQHAGLSHRAREHEEAAGHRVQVGIYRVHKGQVLVDCGFFLRLCGDVS